MLVHGSTLAAEMWLPLVEPLAESYRIVAPDLPRHGARSGERFRFDRAVGLLAEVVERELDGRALVVGISLGGHVATALARARPDLVVGLVAASASVSYAGPLALYLRAVGFVMARVLDEGWLARQLERSIRRRYSAEAAEAMVRPGLFPRGAGESFLELAGRDFAAELRAVNVPTLVLNGELDSASRRGESRLVGAPCVRVAVLEGAGHFASNDRPLEFAAAVLRFAGEIGWRAAR
jgi:pimeloyl-ACP methyl ester carboxylesterase